MTFGFYISKHVCAMSFNILLMSQKRTHKDVYLGISEIEQFIHKAFFPCATDSLINYTQVVKTVTFSATQLKM